ncbi:RNA polymerase sigma factor [Chloroflexota bacterium]
MDLEQEKKLVEKAKGDANAFGSLYDLYYSNIFGYVLRRTANIQVTEDITSEVFFKALKNIAKFNWRGVPFSAYLYRIATNEIASYFRHSKKSQVRQEDIDESDMDSIPSSEEELLEAVKEIIPDRLASLEKNQLALRSLLLNAVDTALYVSLEQAGLDHNEAKEIADGFVERNIKSGGG